MKFICINTNQNITYENVLEYKVQYDAFQFYSLAYIFLSVFRFLIERKVLVCYNPMSPLWLFSTQLHNVHMSKA